jgi:hypothetical protein
VVGVDGGVIAFMAEAVAERISPMQVDEHESFVPDGKVVSPDGVFCPVVSEKFPP